MSRVKSFRSWVLGLDPREVRGLGQATGCDSSRVARFELVTSQFAAGHQAALEAPDLGVLGNRLERMDAEPRVFAYEGAGMALAADDTLVRHDVEVLHPDTDQVFVRGALIDGELVVARGLHRLAPGMTVRRMEAAR